jgi:hypothetical protein
VNKFYLLLIVTVGITAATVARAEVSLGVGYSSFTSAQNIPSLLFAYEQPAWSIDFTSTGFASKYDYFSGYSSSYYWNYKAGSFLGGDLDAGMGLGLYYTQRGYRSSLSGTVTSKGDVGLGPSFNARWSLTKWFFIRLQSLLAVGHMNNMFLFFQDSSHFSLGFQW